MDVRTNLREKQENFIRGKHLKLTELQEELRRSGIDNLIESNWIFQDGNIPLYPRPEFHVSHLRHDTNALFEIEKTGFCAPYSRKKKRYPKDPHRKNLLWWSASVQDEDWHSAEERLLDRTYPDRTEEQKAEQQKGFLKEFATSPVFLDTSRYGSYRLTFPLEELREEYRTQVCDGSEPVLRVYETILYKQEVLYSVLVHKDDDDCNNAFNEYPLLDDSPDAVCAYKDGQIIWRSEAMCHEHSLELVNTPENQLKAESHDYGRKFYVWDHVALAFYLPNSQMLKMDTNRMRENLKFCKLVTDKKYVSDKKFKMAKKEVEAQWPDHGPFKG